MKVWGGELGCSILDSRFELSGLRRGCDSLSCHVEVLGTSSIVSRRFSVVLGSTLDTRILDTKIKEVDNGALR